MKAVRLAASSASGPSSGGGGRRDASPASRVRRRDAVRRLGVVLVEAGARLGHGDLRDLGDDEPGRDDRPCPRDPRGACPAMSHLSSACVSPGRSGPVRWAHVRGRVARDDDPAVPPCTGTCGGPGARPRLATTPHRLTAMRVRAFELRLIAVALVACWAVAAGLVLLAYRPGGPFDIVVGLTAMTPDRHRVRRGDLAAGRPRQRGVPGDRRGSACSRCCAWCRRSPGS